ncbi:MAG: hypothetical protein ACRC1H_10365, partial [Caldilineaceae bacterium]
AISVVAAEGAVHFVEASNRALEVRAALRWLKQRVVGDGLAPEECALVARTIDPYLPHILQIADEFGLALRLVGGLPLRTSPPVAALLALLRALLPGADGQPDLPRRALVELWRSPYFDWRPLGIEAGDADRLDVAARAGLVVRGLAQWREALALLAQAGNSGEPVDPAGDEDEETSQPPAVLAARHLLEAFGSFVERLTPPATALVRDYVALVEEWLGNEAAPEDDAALAALIDDDPGEAPIAPELALGVLAAATTGGGALAERDLAALRAFKEILRGLTWAGNALESPPLQFAAFVRDVEAAVAAAAYFPPLAPTGHFLVAGLAQARGVPLKALALLGMAEGEIPQRTSEDPFLRDAERARLQRDFPGINLVAESAEYEFFL